MSCINLNVAVTVTVLGFPGCIHFHILSIRMVTEEEEEEGKKEGGGGGGDFEPQFLHPLPWALTA